MRVGELWRYPVKSLLGERVARTPVAEDGFAGDRSWGILDVATGQILTGRREPRLLFAMAALTSDGEPRIVLPGGDVLIGCGRTTDEALSSWLGRAVTLVAAAESPAARAEYFADATDDASEAIEWTMPKGRFVDALPILVLTTAGLRAAKAAYPAGEWDARRFRPNILVEADGKGWIEDAWCGRVLRVGEVELAPRKPCIRCTMVTRPQPGLAKDLDVFRTVWRTHGGTAGVWTSILKGGEVAEGDPVLVG
jgi:uncharacterized protein YcbX